MSLVCAEGTADPPFQEEGIQEIQPREADSAADEACTAGDTVQPALRDGTTDFDIAIVKGIAGGNTRC